MGLIWISSGQARIEKKLNEILQEVRSGKRTESIISTPQAVESLIQDEEDVWRELGREFEDAGITYDMVVEHKEFIMEWIRANAADNEWLSQYPSSGSSGSTTRAPSPNIPPQLPVEIVPLQPPSEELKQGSITGGHEPTVVLSYRDATLSRNVDLVDEVSRNLGVRQETERIQNFFGPGAVKPVQPPALSDTYSAQPQTRTNSKPPPLFTSHDINKVPNLQTQERGSPRPPPLSRQESTSYEDGPRRNSVSTWLYSRFNVALQSAEKKSARDANNDSPLSRMFVGEPSPATASNPLSSSGLNNLSNFPMYMPRSPSNPSGITIRDPNAGQVVPFVRRTTSGATASPTKTASTRGVAPLGENKIYLVRSDWVEISLNSMLLFFLIYFIGILAPPLYRYSCQNG